MKKVDEEDGEEEEEAEVEAVEEEPIGRGYGSSRHLCSDLDADQRAENTFV